MLWCDYDNVLLRLGCQDRYEPPLRTDIPESCNYVGEQDFFEMPMPSPPPASPPLYIGRDPNVIAFAVLLSGSMVTFAGALRAHGLMRQLSLRAVKKAKQLGGVNAAQKEVNRSQNYRRAVVCSAVSCYFLTVALTIPPVILWFVLWPPCTCCFASSMYFAYFSLFVCCGLGSLSESICKWSEDNKGLFYSAIVGSLGTTATRFVMGAGTCPIKALQLLDVALYRR